MKKTLSIILTLFLLFALTGCNGTIGENNSTVETVIIDETIKAHADAQAVTGSGTLPELSAEDKAVKAEIAKHIDTKVDFRYNRQETIGEKTYILTFKKVEIDAAKNDESQRIIYSTKNGDNFIYNIKKGNLIMAYFTSAITSKTESSIDILLAEKIAYVLAKDFGNINNYNLSEKNELSYGYSFKYNKYVENYKTSEGVTITIGFNGDVVMVEDWTDIFDGIELTIDENWVNIKLQEVLAKYEAGTAEITDKWISAENGKPCLMVEVAYGVAPDGTIGTAATVYTFPFEN